MSEQGNNPAAAGTTGTSATHETVTLKCQHTHDRQTKHAGDRITVSKGEAKALRDQGVCK